MRVDSILMVLGVAAVAAATYFILEITVPQKEPQLASVKPEEPPVVVQEEAAESVDKSEKLR